MSAGSKRTRSERVAALELPPGRLARVFLHLRRGSVLVRLALCFLAAAALWLVSGAGVPPFPYRENEVPLRDITARIAFSRPDQGATDRARALARERVLSIYENDPDPLVQLQAKLRNTLDNMLAATTLMDLGLELWSQFSPPPPAGVEPPTREKQEEDFERFRANFTGEEKLTKFQADLDLALAPFRQKGLLARLPDDHQGDQREIFVQPVGQPDRRQVVGIDEVLLGDGSAVRKSLRTHLADEEVADRVFYWMQNQLPETLRLNLEATALARDQAAESVGEQFTLYTSGQVLVPAERSLTPDDLALLRLEYDAVRAARPALRTAARSVAYLTVVAALFGVAGFFLRTRAPRLLAEPGRLAVVLLLAVAAVALARLLADAADTRRAELIPLLLFGMTMAIAYGREVALMLSLAVAVLAALALGQGLPGFLVLAGSSAIAVTLCGEIRSRTRLITIGLIVGLGAAALSFGAGLLAERPPSWSVLLNLLQAAGWNLLWGVLAGFVMTGLLPFIERAFDVLTELSLLELGDVAHPLLQELVRRAPGTYNHSINVASLAEAAADAIGARGLLVRVGAYFHDIGKMLKPAYFAENQGPENRHESLLPAMSTLVIIAHVKDGADLARKHRLPQAIVDFIEQHHGTTLVEYFYRRASEQSEKDPDAGEVDEDAFRYPGPKPQSREAGVLMLADAVEGASRTLTEPGPARIESLVRDIAMRRLLDGQFDESGLNLTELRAVQDSLIKSLIAVYHARVRYPDQRTA
jgi:putative nucleotidyltransferase with HDIG domain